MHFTDIFIRRPVFASVLSLLLLVAGLVSFFSMPLRQYPVIASSVITVRTVYPGASADLMSGFVTIPLENAVGTIDGIDYMTSSSSQGLSTITVNLKLGFDMEQAITDVGNQVSSVRWKLPKNIQDPVIGKTDPNATPILYIAFDSDDMTPEDVTDYIIRVVQPQFATLDGVSEAKIFGERQYAMRIGLTPQRMAARGLTANDIYSAISQNSLQAAAGKISSTEQEFNVTTNTEMSDVQEFKNLVIKNEDGYLVRLHDVTDVELGAKSYDTSAVVNGKNTVVMGIIPQSTANPLTVATTSRSLIDDLGQHLPKGMKSKVIYDNSLFITESIHEVYKTVLEASACVLLVIFIFLGSLRAVIVPIITIPLSLIGVCTVMLALGYTINILTLLAMVLAIGLVVDDAIVVLENIHRHIELGRKPIPASIIGAREIGFAVIAMTITLATVYAPIGFAEGLTGILFSEFALSLAGAVIISGFIALTLSPMMCSKLLSHEAMDTGLARVINTMFDKIVVGYRAIVRLVVTLRWLVVLGALVIYAGFGYYLVVMPGELAPYEDQGFLLVKADGPSSANLNYVEKYTKPLQQIFESVGEMENYGIINGFPTVTSSISFLTLLPWEDRDKSADEVVQALQPQLWGIPGLSIFPINPQPLPGSSSFWPVDFVMKSTESPEKLLEYAEKLKAAAFASPIFSYADIDLKLDKPQIHIDINRDKAGDLGVNMQQIASSLNFLLASPTDIQFSIQGRGYYVIPEYKDNFDNKNLPEKVKEFYVRNDSGQMVQLDNMINVENRVEAQSIAHFQQLTSVTLSANLNPGYTQGQALAFLNDYVYQNFPGVQTDTSGTLRQYVQASGAIAQVGVLAVIFIFLVLAAQFESFRDPIIILTTVPLSLSGALWTLNLVGGTLNIYTQIGLVTLVGLVSKHGILIVEFANALQKDGRNRIDAVIEGAALRLRPILMTTGAMVLGALPLALATGAGSASRQQLGWVIVGGMCVGTVFSLFLVPAVYAIMAKDRSQDDDSIFAIHDAEEAPEH